MKKIFILSLATLLLTWTYACANQQNTDNFSKYMENLKTCTKSKNGNYIIKGINAKGKCEVSAQYTETDVVVTPEYINIGSHRIPDYSKATAEYNTQKEKTMTCSLNKEQRMALYNAWLKDNDEDYIKSQEARNEFIAPELRPLASLSMYSRIITTYTNQGICK